MNIKPFALERYFAQYEFSVSHQLSTSDCETMTVRELLSLAGMAPEDGMGELGELSLGYTESMGDPELRKMLARRYSGVEAEMVLTAAPAEAIFLLLNSLLEAGDKVLVIDPCYQSLSSVPEAIGCEVIPWPVRLENGSWMIDIGELKKRLEAPTPPKMVIVNFPHNPTGYRPSQQEFSRIVELCEQSGTLLFSDEMYRELNLFGETSSPAACELSSLAISLEGLSKSFGLPGLRMGWLVCLDKEIIRRAASLKDYTTICAPPPVEYLSRAALSAEPRLTARARAIVEENCRITEKAFAGAADFTWIPPMAGSVAFPRYTGKEGAASLSMRLIREADTLMLPGSLFGFSDSHFRVGLGRKAYPEALSRLLRTART
jgi:aspartate/methionine/tyrosine aminotransferase